MRGLKPTLNLFLLIFSCVRGGKYAPFTGAVQGDFSSPQDGSEHGLLDDPTLTLAELLPFLQRLRKRQRAHPNHLKPLRHILLRHH